MRLYQLFCGVLKDDGLRSFRFNILHTNDVIMTNSFSNLIFAWFSFTFESPKTDQRYTSVYFIAFLSFQSSIDGNIPSVKYNMLNVNVTINNFNLKCLSKIIFRKTKISVLCETLTYYRNQEAGNMERILITFSDYIDILLLS
jgi:hypothetical protein